MKALKITLILLMVLLLSLGAQAQLQISDVKLGDDSQDRGETASTAVTIKNIGNETISDLVVSFPGVNSKYRVNYTLSGTTINPNETVDLTVRGFITLDLDAVDNRGRKVSVDIGDVLVQGDAGGDSVSKQVNLLMEAENKLEFSSGSEIDVDGDTTSLRDGKNIKDIKRGSDLSFTIEVENKFSDSGDCQEDGKDCEIQDIEVVIESRDSDLDLDEDLGFDDLRADRKSTESFSFSVDEETDEDDYDIDMWVTGTDENGARHGERWEFTLEVEVPRDEVTITSYDLIPDTISCDMNKVSLDVSIKNTGRDDQSEVSIFLDSAKLDIRQSIYNIELDEGDRTTKTFSLDLPKNLDPGQYFIQIIANVDHDEETDRDAARLVVEECQQSEEQPPEENDSDNIDIIEIPPTGGVIIGEPKEKNFFDSGAYVLLLAVLAVIALLLVILLLVMLFK